MRSKRNFWNPLSKVLSFPESTITLNDNLSSPFDMVRNDKVKHIGLNEIGEHNEELSSPEEKQKLS